jgi:protein-S-isoprenylcysteine O-methyltransferase Ste14
VGNGYLGHSITDLLMLRKKTESLSGGFFAHVKHPAYIPSAMARHPQ